MKHKMSTLNMSHNAHFHRPNYKRTGPPETLAFHGDVGVQANRRMNPRFEGVGV